MQNKLINSRVFLFQKQAHEEQTTATYLWEPAMLCWDSTRAKTHSYWRRNQGSSVNRCADIDLAKNSICGASKITTGI